jgi:hypothetical protein
MLEDAIATVPPEVIGTGFIVGTPEQVAARLREFGTRGCDMSCSGLFRPSSRCGTWSTQGGRSEGSLAHCGRDGPRPANHQLGRCEAAVPAGVYDKLGSPLEATTWKQLGEWVGALG